MREDFETAFSSMVPADDEADSFPPTCVTVKEALSFDSPRDLPAKGKNSGMPGTRFPTPAVCEKASSNDTTGTSSSSPPGVYFLDFFDLAGLSCCTGSSGSGSSAGPALSTLARGL